MGDFIEDLKRNGYIKDNNETGALEITAKSEQSIRKKSWKKFSVNLKRASRETIQQINPGRVMK
jgi:hypothetical protein